jgi:beta-lactamase class A
MYTKNGALKLKRHTDVAMFWDTAPCSPYVNWRFGRKYHYHLQDRKSGGARNQHAADA